MTNITTVTSTADDTPEVRRVLNADDWIMRASVVALGIWMVLAVLLPLYFLFSKSIEDHNGNYIGVSNFLTYFSSPVLFQSIYNSFFVAIVSTVITISLGFTYAYALNRSCIPGKGIFRAIGLVPILAPTLLPAISFIYLFGNQGVAKWMLGGNSIYGPIGIIMSEVYHTLPHAMIILTTALSIADSRMYEAALSLRASKARIFFTVTLPSVKYGLISASFVVFTLVITDFGIPKVIGAQYNVLATDIYKQVVGQQNFEMGAVVGIVLLIPAFFAFVLDRIIQRKQMAPLTTQSVLYEPKPNRTFDYAMFGYCTLIVIFILCVIFMATYASFVKYWPYNLEFVLDNYDFNAKDGGGWASFYNSLRMAFLVAVIGTIIVFLGAYVIEKTRDFAFIRAAIQFFCLLPMAIPGLVLGLAYIFFFNHPDNPLGFLYGTMSILVLCTIAHFYTVSHLTASTALKQMDSEFESVSISLKVPVFKTFFQVTVPVCVPAIFDISVYFFINAMTTVSAVVFLYSPTTKLASVAALSMDDSGEDAAAAAMCLMIVLASTTARGLHYLLTRGIHAKTQAWRQR